MTCAILAARTSASTGGHPTEANIRKDWGYAMPAYDRCGWCGVLFSEATSAFCPRCGKALAKWCPRCGEWMSPFFMGLEVDEAEQPPSIDGPFRMEAKFCQECGTELVTKPPPHE
jgi:hypothetical protein